MLRILDAAALVAVICSLIVGIRVMRQRTAADETYAPSDRSALLLTTGLVICFPLAGLQLPLLLAVSTCVACFGAYFEFAVWFVGGHKSRFLVSLPDGVARLIVGLAVVLFVVVAFLALVMAWDDALK